MGGRLLTSDTLQERSKEGPGTAHTSTRDHLVRDTDIPGSVGPASQHHVTAQVFAYYKVNGLRDPLGEGSGPMTHRLVRVGIVQQGQGWDARREDTAVPTPPERVKDSAKGAIVVPSSEYPQGYE